ncbi:MAG: tyrosine-type recombinase/integrase [Eggerthellaceae bacterium]
MLLGLATGMRKGEVLGLTWRHVDLEGGELYVAQALGKDMAVRDPKTERSKRWITLNEGALERLRAWKVEQARQLAELDARNLGDLAERGLGAEGYRHVLQGRDTPVVTNELGGFTNSDTYARWFRQFCVEHGFGRYGSVEKVGVRTTAP